MPTVSISIEQIKQSQHMRNDQTSTRGDSQRRDALPVLKHDFQWCSNGFLKCLHQFCDKFYLISTDQHVVILSRNVNNKEIIWESTETEATHAVESYASFTSQGAWLQVVQSVVYTTQHNTHIYTTRGYLRESTVIKGNKYKSIFEFVNKSKATKGPYNII